MLLPVGVRSYPWKFRPPTSVALVWKGLGSPTSFTHAPQILHGGRGLAVAKATTRSNTVFWDTFRRSSGIGRSGKSFETWTLYRPFIRTLQQLNVIQVFDIKVFDMDKQADVKADVDRGEPIFLLEPLLLTEGSRHRPVLTDLALDLAQKSTGFRRSLPESLLASLADLVRAMNYYYSNLIEGHDTHPVDIERALKNDYSKDARKRDLQLEAKAHIAIQQWIDRGGLKGGLAITAQGICEIHRRFCELLPEGLLWIDDPISKERLRVVPGKLRRRDVQVGT